MFELSFFKNFVSSFNFTKIFDTSYRFWLSDLKNRYTSSFLGLLWIILYPLLMLLISIVVFSFVFKSFTSDIPYLIFVMIGIVHWNFFASTVLNSSHVLIDNREIIKNSIFPRISLIISVVFSRSVDFLISLIILFLLLGGYGLFPSAVILSIYVLVLLGQIFFQTGVSLLVAMGVVFFRDIRYITEVFIQTLFYLSPVLYPLAMIPEIFRFLLNFNPLVLLLNTYRDLLVQLSFDVFSIFLGFIFSLLFLIISGVIFINNQHKFSELL